MLFCFGPVLNPWEISVRHWEARFLSPSCPPIRKQYKSWVFSNPTLLKLFFLTNGRPQKTVVCLPRQCHLPFRPKTISLTQHIHFDSSCVPFKSTTLSPPILINFLETSRQLSSFSTCGAVIICAEVPSRTDMNSRPESQAQKCPIIAAVWLVNLLTFWVQV